MASQALASLGQELGRQGGNWRDLFGALAERRFREQEREFERNQTLAQMQNNAAQRAFQRRMQKRRLAMQEERYDRQAQRNRFSDRMTAVTTPGMSLGPDPTSPQAQPTSMESVEEMVGPGTNYAAAADQEGQLIGFSGRRPVLFDRSQVGQTQDETLMPWEEQGFREKGDYLDYLRQKQAATTSPRGERDTRMTPNAVWDRLTDLYTTENVRGEREWLVPQRRVNRMYEQMVAGERNWSDLPSPEDMQPDQGEGGRQVEGGGERSRAGGGGTDFLTGLAQAVGLRQQPDISTSGDPSRTTREAEFDRDLDAAHDSLDRQGQGRLQGPGEETGTLPPDSMVRNRAEQLAERYGSAQDALNRLSEMEGLNAADKMVMSALRGMAGGGDEE